MQHMTQPRVCSLADMQQCTLYGCTSAQAEQLPH